MVITTNKQVHNASNATVLPESARRPNQFVPPAEGDIIIWAIDWANGTNMAHPNMNIAFIAQLIM